MLILSTGIGYYYQFSNKITEKYIFQNKINYNFDLNTERISAEIEQIYNGNIKFEFLSIQKLFVNLINNPNVTKKKILKFYDEIEPVNEKYKSFDYKIREGEGYFFIEYPFFVPEDIILKKTKYIFNIIQDEIIEHKVEQLNFIKQNLKYNFEDEALSIIDQMKSFSKNFEEKYDKQTLSEIKEILMKILLSKYTVSTNGKGFVSDKTLNKLDQLITDYKNITIAALDENKFKFLQIENNVLPYIIIFPIVSLFILLLILLTIENLKYRNAKNS